MLGDRAHGIIADASGDREADPGGVTEERIKSTVAAIIQVHIGTAVVGEDEVADGVGALDREGVIVKGLDEPWVFCGNEFARFRVCPELICRVRNGCSCGLDWTGPDWTEAGQTYHVLVVMVEVNTTLLSGLPLHRDRLVDVGLVDDLRDHLRPILQEIGARRRDLSAVNGICRPIFEQQRDQSAEGIEEKGNDHEVDHKEGDGSSPHYGSSREILGEVLEGRFE